MSIDAAAVFNNPAQQFLLSDSGRMGRKMLSFTGVFSNTQHAFDALAKAFDVSTDELIKAFFSKRVIVMWDSIAASDSAFGLANAMDTNWTIACEVEPEYIQQIRLHLKPIRRSIEHGQTIYAIEKGRYELVLLTNNHLRSEKQKAAATSMIILAPKRGAKLLDQVLESFASNPDAANKPNHKAAAPRPKSILHTREKLIASIEAQSTPWSAAWIIQLDRFMNIPQSPAVQSQEPKVQSAAAGLLNINAGKVSALFSTDIKLNLPKSDAPIGLLGAVGGDAILAVALSKTPTLLVDRDIVHYMFNLGISTDILREQDPSMYPDGPGLILLSKVPNNQSDNQSNNQSASKYALPIALTLMTQLDQPNGHQHKDTQESAIHADRIMHDLFATFNTDKAPSFQGRFPNVIRSHTFQNPSYVKTTLPQSTWPGQFGNISWVSSTFSKKQVLITSLAPHYADTTSRVRWVVEATQSLDAIPSEPVESGIIFSGYLRPNQMLPLFESSDSTNAISMGILKLIDRVQWELARSPVGLRGTTSIEFARFGNSTKLGKR